MLDRSIKIGQTFLQSQSDVAQKYIKSLEEIMGIIWEVGSFSFYAVTFSDSVSVYVNYPTDLSEAEAIAELESAGLKCLVILSIP
jgi:hypothetical protein